MENIVHREDLPWAEWQEGEHFEGRRKQLGAAAGGKQLGCSLIQLAPGKRPWPAHAHMGNEEAIYVLKGTGTLRLGDTERSVKAGDYIAFPASPDQAHQLRNSGSEVLEYLCISTMNHTDVIHYPDSGKIGVFAGSAPGGSKQERYVGAFYPKDSNVDYWEGEA